MKFSEEISETQGDWTENNENRSNMNGECPVVHTEPHKSENVL